jgi:hypothetical protein
MDEAKVRQEELDVEAKARREFLKRIGTAGATAPAVALLLAANVKSATATPQMYGGGCGCGNETI